MEAGSEEQGDATRVKAPSQRRALGQLSFARTDPVTTEVHEVVSTPRSERPCRPRVGELSALDRSRSSGGGAGKPERLQARSGASGAQFVSTHVALAGRRMITWARKRHAGGATWPKARAQNPSLSAGSSPRPRGLLGTARLAVHGAKRTAEWIPFAPCTSRRSRR